MVTDEHANDKEQNDKEKEPGAAEYIASLDHALTNLTGYDMEAAENEERAGGNMIPDITFSKGFQARLAARALSVPLDKIKGLKVNAYATITAQVSNFLFGNLAEMAKVRRKNIEKLP